MFRIKSGRQSIVSKEKLNFSQTHKPVIIVEYTYILTYYIRYDVT